MTNLAFLPYIDRSWHMRCIEFSEWLPRGGLFQQFNEGENDDTKTLVARVDIRDRDYFGAEHAPGGNGPKQ
jgi:hypothetical protein